MEPAILYIKEFGTDYVPVKDKAGKPTGELKGRDWVEYAPMAGAQKTLVRAWIEHLNCPAPLTGRGSENPAVALANMRWDAIRPRYDAWKAGQELPPEGTPLAAWNGVSRQLAEKLRMHGVRSVEEVAALTDSHIQGLGIMGLRNIIEGAKRFVTAQDKNSVTNALAEKDAQIADLRSKMEDQAAQMAELIEMVKEAEPRKRGRPPKAKEDARPTAA
jgi:hypothetical protein